MFHAALKSQALAALCLGVTLTSCAPAQDRAAPAAERTDVVGVRKVIALLPNAQSTNRMRQTAQSRGYQEIDAHRLDGLGLTMLTFRMPDGVTGAEAIEALEAAVPESTVGINHAYRLQQVTQAPGALNYADTLMRWQEGGCRARAPIGIIDTAIDTSSPALQGAEVVTRTFFDGNAAAATHGTDVAALLADPDRLRGVRIYAANVFGQPEASGPVAGADALVRALDWLADENVRFVNLALAGPYNKLLDLAVVRAADRGLVLVAAVGNDGPRVDPLYPAGFSDVIAVTAVDADGRIYRDAVRGSHVDIAAPGVDILVPIDGPARLITGTSIATPFVTARLVADPSVIAARSVADVRNRLATTSAELGPEGRDPVFGYGLALANDICSD
ncbi:S8 family serine peptidase [Ruegeria sp. 2205SS24-7]|uniref:S8 family serine peptidase n=1 Tax=Ruegeria discodermiae TaxID=3064389 RepID=UPI002742633E|nr:S8 family serine peptidase [Ruegeria sp. 2205SS24-7]MDP5220066.1 S8 family serine peptidase [Ruegeria sp. 2205SS24-7]